MATTGAEEEGHNEGERYLASIQLKRPVFLEICLHFPSFFLDNINPRKHLTAFLLEYGSVDGHICLSRWLVHL